ncbi:MAG: hypothetical protein IPN86_10550 [Saprospiraceae bacterium]|nr:hypothetical protein [Saprospiraceae bacterium]
MVTLNPPQCNCPVIPAPVSLGNQKACQNQVGVNLSVTVSTGLSAQWFSAVSGGTLLQDQSLTYAPPTTTVGITTYYASFDPLNGYFQCTYSCYLRKCNQIQCQRYRIGAVILDGIVEWIYQQPIHY